jgi:glycosyltransferase involved in cell wall biosynthesis
VNITHVIPYMHPHAGGPPVVVDRVCQKLAQRGWNVRVITTDSMADTDDETWQARYRESYPMEVHRTGKFRGFAYSSTLAAAIEKAARESDLVHLHTLWTYPTYAAARICRSLGVPFVVMPHGMADPHSLARGWLKKKIYGWLFEWPKIRAAQAMIYTHAEERRLAEQAVSGLPAGHIVPLGADDPPNVPREVLAREFFAKNPDLQGRNIVIFLGRLHPKKGLDLLIPGFAGTARTDANARLLLVGPSDEAYLTLLRGLIARHSIADRVVFTGPMTSDAKWQALAASTVFALPSYQENFALTVVEALRMGVPVVVSRRVNICEDVTNAGAGLACDLAPSSVAECISRYLQDEDRRTASGACGQQLVAERFNWDRCVESLESVYRRILGEKATAAQCVASHG